MGDPLPVAVENPMYVPVTDQEFLWNQVVDTVDDYFRIAREEHPHVTSEMRTEGRVETVPQIGASLLQPNRRDSLGFRERLHASLQTIRRRAVVRVVPWEEGGYLLEVIVLKELEDLSRPEQSTVGGATLRHDGSLVRPIDLPKNSPPFTMGWIPLGRDQALEQKMLSEMRGRLMEYGQPVRIPAVSGG